MTVASISEFADNFDVSCETSETLTKFAAMVVKWNPAINLVSKNSVKDIWGRHISDAAQVNLHIPQSTRHIADLGSGGGFPGIVLAIMGRRTDRRVDLIEADERKAAFLQTVVTTLNLPAKVVNRRIESTDLTAYEVLTARALTNLEGLLKLVENRRSDAVCLFLKGENLHKEIAQAKMMWRFEYDLIPSMSDPKSAIIRIGKSDRVC